MLVVAAIEAIQTQHICVVLQDEDGMFHWLRAQPGHASQGPFATLPLLFSDMTLAEGKPENHFERVFKTLYPTLITNKTSVNG